MRYASFGVLAWSLVAFALTGTLPADQPPESPTPPPADATPAEPVPADPAPTEPPDPAPAETAPSNSKSIDPEAGEPKPAETEPAEPESVDPAASAPPIVSPATTDELRATMIGRYEQIKASIATGQANADDAAQKLFRVLMLAEVVGDPNIANEIRVLLLLDYPGTLQSRYLVRQFANETAHRQLLFQAWNSEPRPLSEAFFRKFQLAVRLGVGRWQGALFSDDNLVIASALCAHQTGDMELLAFLQLARPAANSQTGADPGETANIVLLDRAPREQFLRLVPHCNQFAASDFCAYLYSKIPADERQAPDVMAGRVRQLMASRRYDAAQPVAQRLATREPTPLHHLWQAWSQALAGQTDEALETLDAMAAAGEPRELADECRQLRLAVATLQSNTDAHLQAIQKTLALMSRGGELQALEMQARFGEGLANRAYLGIDVDKRAIGIELLARGKPVFASRIEEGSSRFYVQGEDRVIAYRELASFPVATATLARAPNGAFTFNYNVSVTATAQPATSPLQSLIASPWLVGEGGLRDLLKHSIQIGWLPLPIEDMEGQAGRRLRWISLNRDHTGHQSYEFCLSPDDRLTAIKADWLEVTSIRYGQSGGFQLSMPSLPDHPLQWREKFDGASLFKMFASICKIFEGGASQVAARPK